jgi:hypothetical protein
MLLESQISKYALHHGYCSLATADRSVEWLGSLPLRGGITLDRTLIYATGGFAAGDVDMRFTSINGNISGHALALIKHIVVTPLPTACRHSAPTATPSFPENNLFLHRSGDAVTHFD